MRKPLHITGLSYPRHWILSCLIVGLLWVGIIVRLDADYSTAIRSGQANAANLAHAFEENVTHAVEGVDQRLIFARAAYLHDRTGQNLDDWMRALDALHGPHVELVIADPNGAVIWSSRKLPDNTGVAKRQYLLAQKDNPADTLSIAAHDRFTDLQTVQFTRKIILPDGSSGGVVAASLAPSHLLRFHESLGDGDALTTLLLQDGTILAQAPDKGAVTGSTGSSGAWLAKAHRLSDGVDSDEQIVCVRHLEQYPLTVLVALSRQVALADFYRIRKTILATGTILTALGGLVGFVLSQQRKSLLDARNIRSAILDNISEGITMVDADDRVLFMNQRLLTMLSLPPEMATGAYTLQEVLEWQVSHSEFGEGSIGVAELHRVQEQVREGNGSSRYERQRPDGSTLEIRTVEVPGGSIVRTFADITERKRNQEALLAAQTRAEHAERMQALGELAGGIAHDFNNILQAVQGAATVIENRAGDATDLRQLVRMIMDVTERGTSITGRLLAFARRGALRAEPIDCAELLADLRKVLAHTLESAISIEISVAPDSPPLFGDKAQLQTVLVNLATNARDAMPQGGVLSINASQYLLPPERAMAEELRPGRYVQLTVSDTGSGMDQATLKRVQEPFFSTKPAGQGTGLGLSMAKGFAEQSNGCLSIESTLGKGTKVHIWLPAANPTTREAGDAILTLRQPDGQQRRVLLVDCEDAVRHSVAEMLEDAGYTVHQTRSGGAVLELLTKQGPFDVLVSTLSLPTKNGLAIVREAHRLYPDLPAVLLTERTDVATRLADDMGPVRLLRRPFTAAQMLESIEALLPEFVRS